MSDPTIHTDPAAPPPDADVADPDGAARQTPAWQDANLHDPHAVADKARRVRQMFAAIAGSYDLNNRLHSMGRDQAWRRKVVRLTEPLAGDTVVDVAAGTGDLSLLFAHRLAALGPSASDGAKPRRAGVLGIDFTHEMLLVAQEKGRRQLAPLDRFPQMVPLDELVAWTTGDAMALPLPDRSADIVTIAFGIRNVAEPQTAINEFARVLRSGGRLCILEFSLPTNALLRRLYQVYFRHVMPRTATWIARDRSGAYKYLPRSVNTFLGREELSAMIANAGFERITQHPLTLGIAVAYLAHKP